jgi:hypothetical protein
MGELVRLPDRGHKNNVALLVEGVLRRGAEAEADHYYARQRSRLLDALLAKGISSVEARERVLGFVEATNATLLQRLDSRWTATVAARARRSAVGSLAGALGYERELARSATRERREAGRGEPSPLLT